MTNNSQGFTLIEFLVAIVILMVGMLGLLQAVNVAIDKNLENVFRTEAVMLADSKMMEIKSRAYDSISTVTNRSLVARDVRGVMKNYSVIRATTQPTTKSKQIMINVKWRKKNTPYSHSVESIVSNAN